MEPALILGGQIAELESAMHTSPDKIHIEPRHLFAPGLYVREVTLPTGSTAIGHRHKQEHVCIISQGRVLVITEDGREELTAPCTMIVPAGRKNVVHVLEEAVWTTIHHADSRDVDELFALLVEPEEKPECPSLQLPSGAQP